MNTIHHSVIVDEVVVLLEGGGHLKATCCN